MKNTPRHRPLVIACAMCTVLLTLYMAARPRRPANNSRHVVFNLPHPPVRRIPKTIWQTTRDGNSTSPSWRQNAEDGFEYNLHGDDEMIAFLRRVGLGGIVDAILTADAPMVMLSDVWRYAILYHFGGFYADYDTVCNRPIRSWLPHDTMGDCDVIIGLENDVHFCQWTFASTPGHPFLARVLELINERARVPEFPRTDLPDFVHFHTGPGVFTDAIIDVLFDEVNDGRTRSTTAVEAFTRLSTDETTSVRAHQLGACFLDANAYNGDLVSHQFSSQWVGTDAEARKYASWTVASERFRSRKTPQERPK